MYNFRYPAPLKIIKATEAQNAQNLSFLCFPCFCGKNEWGGSSSVRPPCSTYCSGASVTRPSSISLPAATIGPRENERRHQSAPFLLSIECIQIKPLKHRMHRIFFCSLCVSVVKMRGRGFVFCPSRAQPIFCRHPLPQPSRPRLPAATTRPPMIVVHIGGGHRLPDRGVYPYLWSPLDYGIRGITKAEYFITYTYCV